MRNCKHWSSAKSRKGGNCSLNSPTITRSFGVCRHCPHDTGDDRWIDVESRKKITLPNSDKPKRELPSSLDMLKSFSRSAGIWAKAGFPTVSKELYNERRSICESCDSWQPEALFGAGRCGTCGCTSVKHHLATEKCPLGKWTENT